MAEKRPAELIREQYDLRANWSDEAILADSQALPVLADEYDEQSGKPRDDSHWGDPEIYGQLTRYLALVDIVSERKLRAAVPLLMERASYGDMGESMRNVWGALASVYDDEATWDDLCFQMAESPYRGVRLWMMLIIGCTEDDRSLPALIKGLRDPARRVREWAAGWMESLCEYMPQKRAEALQALQEVLPEIQDAHEHRGVLESIRIIQNMANSSEA